MRFKKKKKIIVLKNKVFIEVFYKFQQRLFFFIILIVFLCFYWGLKRVVVRVEWDIEVGMEYVLERCRDSGRKRQEDYEKEKGRVGGEGRVKNGWDQIGK